MVKILVKTIFRYNYNGILSAGQLRAENQAKPHNFVFVGAINFVSIQP
jgi:hypothetical protein